MRKRPFVGAWLAILALILVATAGRAIDEASRQPEFVAGCDSFGYLSMAREVRHAWAERRLPQFALASAQSEALVRELSRSGLPRREWDHLVGPHAYYYAESSRRTIPQYPPGTALAVAPFSEGNAVFSLARVDIVISLLLALGAFVVAAGRGGWISAGWIALVAYFAIRLPGAVGDRSFSVEALLLPCGAGSALAAIAWERVAAGRARAFTLAAAAVAGALLGFSILCRLPCALLVPGLVLPFLLLGRRGLAPAAVLSAGVFVCGLLPLFVHQAALTGHFYLPTYSLSTVTPEPSWKVVLANLPYYLGKGEGAGYNWAFVTLLVSVPAALTLGAFPRRRELAIVGVGALVAWAIPAAYFLLYQVQEPYYLAAGTLAGLIFFVAGASRLEIEGLAPARRALGGWARLARLAFTFLAAWPALSVAPGALKEATFPRRSEAPAVNLAVPPELRDPRAWVWAEYYSGTLTYFGGHPAFKLPFSTPESRSLAFAVARGSSREGQAVAGPQYLVEDSSSMTELARELRESGAKLTPLGRVEPFPFYRIQWPGSKQPGASGAFELPREKQAARD